MDTNLPGLVDLQVNGFMGINFSDLDLTCESFSSACRSIIDKGITRFCPTIITSPPEVYKQNLAIMAEVISSSDLKNHLLGIHIEGPFFSNRKNTIGCHNPDWLRPGDIHLVEQMQKWACGNIKILTIAADIPDAEGLTLGASEMGITVFLAHHLADVECLKKLAKAGAKAITHLGNGMPATVNRFNNPLMHALAADELAATIITDGHHLPEHLIRIIVRCKGIDNIAVISDCSPIAGLPPGDYTVLGKPVRLDASGLLYNREHKFLVGSSFTLVECLNYVKSLNLFSESDLQKLFYENPLRFVGFGK